MHPTQKKIKAGIAFRPEILEQLNRYAEKNTQGDRSEATNQLLEKPLLEFKQAPNCKTCGAVMKPSKKTGFYFCLRGCGYSEERVS